MMHSVHDLLNHRPAIRYFLTLLLLSLGVLTFFSVLGCDSCGGSTPSIYTYSTTTSIFANKGAASKSPPSATMHGLNGVYDHNEQRTITISASSAEAGSNVFISYTPPKGVTDIAFTGYQPQQGGPPYLFNNIPSPANINVSYYLPASSESNTYTDLMTVEDANGYTSSQLTGEYGRAQSLTGPADPNPKRAGSSLAPWGVMRFVDFTAPFTTQVCEDIVAYGQSDSTFYLWRVPVQPQAVIGNELFSTTLPIYTETGNASSNALAIKIYANSYSQNMPMEVRHDATVWANANLNTPAGESWVALGLKKNAQLNCAPAMNYSPWTLAIETHFALDAETDGCEGCSLPAYSCYLNTSAPDSPLARLAIAESLKKVSGGNPMLAVADGTTCIGASPALLNSTADWFFEPYTATLDLDPGDDILVHYWIENKAPAAKTFDLALNSDLAGAVWIIYRGKVSNPDEPDFSQPITSLSVAANTFGHFYLTSVVPANAGGTRSVAVTASNSGMDPTAWTVSTQLIISPLPPIKSFSPPATIHIFLPMLQR